VGLYEFITPLPDGSRPFIKYFRKREAGNFGPANTVQFEEGDSLAVMGTGHQEALSTGLLIEVFHPQLGVVWTWSWNIKRLEEDGTWKRQSSS
jgi:hypothetical protein